MTCQHLEPDRDQLEIFIDALLRYRGNKGYLSLRAFTHSDNLLKPIIKARLEHDDFKHIVDYAEDVARRAANNPDPAVFCPPIAVFNGRSGWQAREQDLLLACTISVECDDNPDEAKQRLEKILGEATVVVRSGGQWINGGDKPEDKLHLHWRLAIPAEGDALKELKEARKLATAIAGGDSTNIPAVHCLRWPGSWHCKAKPRLCEIARYNPDREIDLDEALALLRAAAPAMPGAAAPSHNGGGGEEWSELTANIGCGVKLHQSITVLAAKMVVTGMDNGAIINLLRGLMMASRARSERPDVWQARYDYIPRAVETAQEKFAKPKQEPTPGAPQGALKDVIACFNKWLTLKDTTPIYVALGTVAANLLPGDPVWLGLIAPPSSAKTEILNSLLRLAFVEMVTTITPAALLSGTPKKEKAAEAKGGLLRKIGDFGIMLMPDFGSILSMRSETKLEALAALRHVYDGAYERDVGAEGGRKLKWRGKIGLIFGATEVYDDHHQVIGSLGDRFVLYRITPDYAAQARKALEHRGEATKTMRGELNAVVASLFAAPVAEPQPLTEDETKRLENVVALAIRLRAHVGRDRYSRDIEAVHHPEGPGRIILSLERLFAGLCCIGLDRNQALRVVEEVALASVPPARRQAFELLEKLPKPTREIAKAMNLPTVTTRRHLEDITSQGLAVRSREIKQDEAAPLLESGAAKKKKEKSGGADLWAVAEQWQGWAADNRGAS